MQKPRQIAARLLRQARTGRGFVETRLERELATGHWSAADRRLCQELVCGVLRWQATLDWLIRRKTPERPPPPGVQDILRLGLYQIFWLDRIPDHAAVNETVELAKRTGHARQAALVNAVSRGYLREYEPTRQALERLKTEQPALGWSHPEWLVRRWQERWGATATAGLLAWNNTPPRTFARVNTLKTDPGKLLTRWRLEEDVEYDFVPRLDWVGENLLFELRAHPPLAELKSFRDGWFYVQDPSTLLAVHWLGAQPGEHILDCCAAPGGKTTYLAAQMRNEGCIVAEDVSPGRLRRLEENCARLGVTCVTIQPASPTAASSAPPTAAADNLRPTATEAPFDRVLVDVPCSNTGVLRRRVEARWRLQPGELARLGREQRALLRRAAARVRPGGVLVYSTCSLEPEENQQVVQSFLAEQPDFTLEAERALLPFADGVDGAYVARLRRGLESKDGKGR